MSESLAISYSQDMGTTANPAPSRCHPGPWTQTCLQHCCLPGFDFGHAFRHLALCLLFFWVAPGCPTRSAMHMYPAGPAGLETFGLASLSDHYCFCPPLEQTFKKHSLHGWLFQLKAYISPSVACLLWVIVDTCIDLKIFPLRVLAADFLEGVNFASIYWSFRCSHPGAAQQNNFRNLVGGRRFKASSSGAVL